MFAIDDVDLERARDPCERIGAGIGHDDDGQRRRTPIHEPAVLQQETALASFEGTRDLIDGSVASRSTRARAGREHLATRFRDEITAELLEQQHTREQGVGGSVRVGQRLQRDLETAFCFFHANRRLTNAETIDREIDKAMDQAASPLFPREAPRRNTPTTTPSMMSGSSLMLTLMGSKSSFSGISQTTWPSCL